MPKNLLQKTWSLKANVVQNVTRWRGHCCSLSRTESTGFLLIAWNFQTCIFVVLLWIFFAITRALGSLCTTTRYCLATIEKLVQYLEWEVNKISALTFDQSIDELMCTCVLWRLGILLVIIVSFLLLLIWASQVDHTSDNNWWEKRTSHYLAACVDQVL